MYACMYAYIYPRIYTYIYTLSGYIYIYICTLSVACVIMQTQGGVVPLCTHTRMHAHIHACTRACTRARGDLHIVCVNTHAHCTYTHFHTCRHTVCLNSHARCTTHTFTRAGVLGGMRLVHTGDVMNEPYSQVPEFVGRAQQISADTSSYYQKLVESVLQMPERIITYRCWLVLSETLRYYISDLNLSCPIRYEQILKGTGRYVSCIILATSRYYQVLVETFTYYTSAYYQVLVDTYYTSAYYQVLVDT